MYKRINVTFKSGMSSYEKREEAIVEPVRKLIRLLTGFEVSRVLYELLFFRRSVVIVNK